MYQEMQPAIGAGIRELLQKLRRVSLECRRFPAEQATRAALKRDPETGPTSGGLPAPGKQLVKLPAGCCVLEAVEAAFLREQLGGTLETAPRAERERRAGADAPNTERCDIGHGEFA